MVESSRMFKTILASSGLMPALTISIILSSIISIFLLVCRKIWNYSIKSKQAFSLFYLNYN